MSKKHDKTFTLNRSVIQALTRLSMTDLKDVQAGQDRQAANPEYTEPPVYCPPSPVNNR